MLDRGPDSNAAFNEGILAGKLSSGIFQSNPQPILDQIKGFINDAHVWTKTAVFDRIAATGEQTQIVIGQYGLSIQRQLGGDLYLVVTNQQQNTTSEDVESFIRSIRFGAAAVGFREHETDVFYKNYKSNSAKLIEDCNILLKSLGNDHTLLFHQTFYPNIESTKIVQNRIEPSKYLNITMEDLPDYGGFKNKILSDVLFPRLYKERCLLFGIEPINRLLIESDEPTAENIFVNAISDATKLEVFVIHFADILSTHEDGIERNLRKIMHSLDKPYLLVIPQINLAMNSERYCNQFDSCLSNYLDDYFEKFPESIFIALCKDKRELKFSCNRKSLFHEIYSEPRSSLEDLRSLWQLAIKDVICKIDDAIEDKNKLFDNIDIQKLVEFSGDMSFLSMTTILRNCLRESLSQDFHLKEGSPHLLAPIETSQIIEIISRDKY